MCAHFEIVLILFFKYRSIYVVEDLRKYLKSILQVYQIKMTYKKIQPRNIKSFFHIASLR